MTFPVEAPINLHLASRGEPVDLWICALVDDCEKGWRGYVSAGGYVGVVLSAHLDIGEEGATDVTAEVNAMIAADVGIDAEVGDAVHEAINQCPCKTCQPNREARGY